MTNTSTLESTWAGVHPQFVDQPPLADRFSHLEVATTNARFNGIRQFDDCLGTCRLVCPHPGLLLECVNAVTGWDLVLDDAFKVGRRIVSLLRVFNFRHGMRKEDERPSKKYGSVPVDGPAAGRDIMAKWGLMLETYYTGMGWDPETGRPLPETLRDLDLDDLIADLEDGGGTAEAT
jgi:aldehyde:ferredoxin oxidoreductase